MLGEHEIIACVWISFKSSKAEIQKKKEFARHYAINSQNNYIFVFEQPGFFLRDCNFRSILVYLFAK